MSNIVWIICVIFIIMLSAKINLFTWAISKVSEKYKMRRNLKSINQDPVHRVRFYRILHKIESA